MRLIDADKLQKLFNATSSALLSDVELSKDIEHMVRACLMVSEMISDAPTVDAEPVVRCKDCKWYHNADDKYFPQTCDAWSDMFYCYEGWASVEENGFCSFGERIEDEKTI